jgi:kumamolisin
VHGLQNLVHLKKHAVQWVKSDIHSMENLAGSGPSGGLSPSDIHNAYHLSTKMNGAGQSLALFELDGYSQADIEAYEKNFGISLVKLKNILVHGALGGSGGQGAPEVTLDIELMIALAPKADQILVYEGTNDEQGILATYAQIANDNQARQISTSWGLSEDQTTAALLQTEDAIFKQMAAQGQALFAAAGDSGAYDDGKTLSVDDPASQPYVVGVGGTSLKIKSGGQRVSETSWNTNNTPQGGGGGGGISSVWNIPGWQVHAITAESLASRVKRNVPDVSLNADPNGGYAIYSGASWTIYGGTSCAAPLWAAFHALVNQRREQKKLNPLGFPNPSYYLIGTSQNYPSAFYDIEDFSTNMHYPAVPGYDESTGWGTFNGNGLIKALSQQ